MSLDSRVNLEIKAFSAAHVAHPFSLEYRPLRGAAFGRMTQIRLDARDKAKVAALTALVSLACLPFFILPGIIGGVCVFLWKTAQYKMDLLSLRGKADEEQGVFSFFTTHFGPLSDEEVEAMQAYMALLDEGWPSEMKGFSAFVQLCEEVAQAPWSKELFTRLYGALDDLRLDIAAFEERKALPIIRLITTLANKLICFNTQLNTDGFAIGLFRKNKPQNETLSLDLALEGRAFANMEKADGLGFVTAGKFMYRTGWLNIYPKNICRGNRAFVFGTRQICIKLQNGGRQEARAHLDLSPLGEMTFSQNREVLRFIKELGNSVLEINPLYMIVQDQEDDGCFFELITDSIHEVLKHPDLLEFSDDQRQKLIKIAVEFNYKLYMEMVRAYRELSPDVKESCQDHIAHLIGVQWSEYEAKAAFELLWEIKEGLIKTKDFLDQVDRMQYLATLHRRNSELFRRERLILATLSLKLYTSVDDLGSQEILAEACHFIAVARLKTLNTQII